MQNQMYPRAWRWDTDRDRLEGRFARIDQGVKAPRSGKVADVLVLEVDGVERSLWLWAVALKRSPLEFVWAAFPARPTSRLSTKERRPSTRSGASTGASAASPSTGRL